MVILCCDLNLVLDTEKKINPKVNNPKARKIVLNLLKEENFTAV